MVNISQFLRNKVMLITGATGFLGKPLIAKILTDAPDIDKIYLLVRPKTQADGSLLSAQSRLESEVFNSNVFGKLRQIHGSNFDRFVKQKVVGVSGDISEPHLGIDLKEYGRLTKEVQIIINSAAVVVFDERLDEALRMNAISPINLLNFAKASDQAIFLHVSTAYASGTQVGDIPEEIGHNKNVESLDIEREYAEVLAMSQKLEDESRQPKMQRRFRREAINSNNSNPDSPEKLESLTEAARGRWVRQCMVEYGMKRSKSCGWNDSYTYTKALGERMIIKHRGDLKTVILRPSIIESSIYEPEPGWIDGFRMADPLIIGYGKGRIEQFPGDPNSIIDLIPVDFVVNAMLASLAKAEKESGVKIYQVATGYQTPLTFYSIYDLTRGYFLQNPMLDKRGNALPLSVWRFPTRRMFELKYKLKYMLPLDIATFFVELIPNSKWAIRSRRRLEALKTALERLMYYVKIYSPYTSLNCRFETTNTQKLFSELSQEDKARFNFDLSKFDWDYYLKKVHIPGLKRNILKLETPTENGSQDEPTPEQAEPLNPAKSELRSQENKIENLWQLLRTTAMNLPDKVALQMKQEGQWVKYTYSQIYRLACIIGAKLRKSGIKKGDRVILYSENRPEWGISYFAAISIGAVLVPLDGQTPLWEVSGLADFVDAKAIMLSKECACKLQNSGNVETQAGADDKNNLFPKSLQIFNIDDLCSKAMDALTAQGNQVEEFDEKIDPDEAASIIFTTGMIVDPKGAVLTHRNFISDFLAVSELLKPYENDQFISVLPLYHAFEFTCGFLMAIYGGATVTYVETLKSNVLLNTMREIKATCLIAMPRLFRLLYYNLTRNIEREGIDDSDISAKAKRAKEILGGKVRILVSGGSHLDHDIYDSFMRLNLPIYEGYGLTECAPVLAVNPLHKSKKGSAGLPLPSVELKVDNPDENGVGEIVVRGENVMSGYYNNPEATQKVLKNGWLHTGDLGYMDEDGYIFITGRSKNIIVSGAGKNVYPEEVETIYKNHPYISEICVLGIRGQGTLGEETHAVVVPKKVGQEGKEPEIRALIRQHVQNISKDIPTYRRIQKLHIWDNELPKDENSHLDRKMIKKILLDGSYTDTDGENPKISSSSSFEIPKAGSLESFNPDAAGTWEDGVISWLSRAANIPKDQVKLSANLNSDFGLDSMMKVELLLLLEEKIGLSLPDSIIASIETVHDLVKFGKRGLSVMPLESDEPQNMTKYARLLDARPNAIAKFFRSLMIMAYKTYFRFSCEGLENIQKDEVCLIASNHSSHLDSIAIMTALRRRVEELSVLGAQDYFFDTTLKAWFFSRFLNVIPFDRHGNFVQSVKISQQALSKGRLLLIYPEGTRSINGQLQPFKIGLGLLAQESGAPVVPAYISGTYESMPKGSVFPKRSSIKVKFGKAIKPEKTDLSSESKYEVYKKMVDKVRRSIEELANEVHNPT